MLMSGHKERTVALYPCPELLSIYSSVQIRSVPLYKSCLTSVHLLEVLSVGYILIWFTYGKELRCASLYCKHSGYITHLRKKVVCMLVKTASEDIFYCWYSDPSLYHTGWLWLCENPLTSIFSSITSTIYHSLFQQFYIDLIPNPDIPWMENQFHTHILAHLVRVVISNIFHSISQWAWWTQTK